MICSFADLLIPTYCEHAYGWLVSQPLNVISNFLFFVLAVMAYRAVRDAGNALKSLTLLLGLVGVGSTLFHIFGGVYTVWMDSVPIYAFMLVALGYATWLLTRSIKIAAGVCLAFVALQVGLSFMVPSSFANGSIRHLVTWCVLLGVGIWAVHKHPPAFKLLVLALGSYAIAILARSTDMAICSVWPVGVHFFWHIAVAIAAYVVILLLKRVRELSVRG
jgi:hypothetical protein